MYYILICNYLKFVCFTIVNIANESYLRKVQRQEAERMSLGGSLPAVYVAKSQIQVLLPSFQLSSTKYGIFL
jgi:Na+/melibiose symporter-like transporter